MKQEIVTENAPKADHILSQAILSNGTLYVSGQIHALPDNTLIEGSTKEKIDQIMKNISAILEAAESKLDDIVKVIIYITDITIVPEINEIYASYFSAPFPAREAICVSKLPLGASIEISVIAVKE